MTLKIKIVDGTEDQNRRAAGAEVLGPDQPRPRAGNHLLQMLLNNGRFAGCSLSLPKFSPDQDGDG
jgi:hypothetical protein